MCEKGFDIEMMPLCVCAMDTISPDDVVFGDGQNTGDIRMYYKVVDERCCHSSGQRWYCELQSKCQLF